MNSQMKPEQALKYVTNSMSLRVPQAKSLELFAKYLESEAGRAIIQRMVDKSITTSDLLVKTKEYFKRVPEASGFESFEREFPAFTFALATGVGKTRLMGAFVAYMFLVYGVQHFLIVAPNLTIFRKLNDDFSKPNNPKYVFRGIQEININTTKIITSDNYANQRTDTLFGNKLEINIFNVQQFAQKDMTSERGITKSWENAGQSYFDYLKDQKDLVVMLDEAHHYHADAALGALDLMNPMLGLEFTATPYIGTSGSGKSSKMGIMKNVLYNYNLGDAIRGGYVKDPWIGTEADVDFKQFDGESIETDARKLQLAAYFHERTKNALIQYSTENKLPTVKPVMLVVAKDTAHASELHEFIDSDKFRGGEFKGKVIEVHTKNSKEESEENIEQLLSLESPDNAIEVVIHVNMLKEGWDVNNVYTIVPLRQAAAMILTEQTIGRGLRLPYGERTGNAYVDRVMVVAHEQFSRVIEMAKDSELIQGHVEQISEQEAKDVKVMTEVQPIILQNIQEDIRQNESIMEELTGRAEDAVSRISAIQNLDEESKKVAVVTKREEYVQIIAKESFTANFMKKIDGTKEELVFGEDTLLGLLDEDVRKKLDEIADSNKSELRTIPIPRLMVIPHFSELDFEDFDLRTVGLSNYATEATVLEESLQRRDETNLFDESLLGRRDSVETRVTSFGSNTRLTAESMIIAALMDFPLVDYDEQKEFLLKLASQAVEYYRTKALDEDNLKLIVETNARSIARDIYDQILNHKKAIEEGFLEPDLREPKPLLEQYNISMSVGERAVTLDSQLNTFSRDKVYTGFKKACHQMYKFDSSDEGRLAYLLDKDESVEDWLRPAPNQFEGLFWRDEDGESNNRYEPDFVVEFSNEIVMIEVKPTKDINLASVQAKKKTASQYCEVVNQNVGKYKITKPWRYIIVPTESITIQSTVKRILDTTSQSILQ